MSMGIAQSFGEGAARANPSAVGSFSPEVDDNWNEDEGLSKRDRKPPSHGIAAEGVPDKERPGQDKAKGAPVFTAVIMRHFGKQGIGVICPSAVKESVVSQIRQSDVGAAKKRHNESR